MVSRSRDEQDTLRMTIGALTSNNSTACLAWFLALETECTAGPSRRALTCHISSIVYTSPSSEPGEIMGKVYFGNTI